MDRPATEITSGFQVIIGIGNEYRGDDGAGIAVARELEERHLPGCTVIQERGDGLTVMDRWNKSDNVILVDATLSGSPPGTITRMDLLNQSVEPEMFRFSSHALGLAAAIELARAVHALPSRAILYGIEGKSFETECGLTPRVALSVQEVVEKIVNEISSI